MTELRNAPDLAEQLRRLGETAESAVPPVSASEALDLAGGTDIGTAVSGDGPAGSPQSVRSAVVRSGGTAGRRTQSRRLLVGAAVVAVLAGVAAIGALALRSDGTPVDEVALGGPGEFAVPEDNGWAELRQCESSGDYAIDTGNTFYGAYQFTRAGWRTTATAAGLSSVADMNPALAEPYLQDAIADALYRERGADAWPICGRFIEGPMVTPVVAAWLQPSRGATETIVFLEPSIAEPEVATVGDLLESLVEPDLEPGSASAPSVRFVDKSAAYAEFRAMYSDDPAVPASIGVEDMPPSYRISDSLSAAEVDELRSTPGVLEVISSEDSAMGLEGVPQRLTINSIELETPVLPSPSIENLAQGAAIMADGIQALVVGGYGSVDGSAFDRLDELSEGDVIALTALLEGDSGSRRVELVRYFAVEERLTTAYEQEAPDLDSLLADAPDAGPLTQRLVLVADVAGDSTKRLVVVALPVDPELAGYVLADD